MVGATSLRKRGDVEWRGALAGGELSRGADESELVVQEIATEEQP
jgi:hypothetical protein